MVYEVISTDEGGTATEANSLLVTFDLVPSYSGTLLRFTEAGFREKGWEAAVLSDQLPVTRQAVTKHLGVLDHAGLVHVTPSGRERLYEVDEAQLARAVAQLSSVGTAWDARLQRIKQIAEAIQRSHQG